MVSHERKAIFIHIPKTGGTSIEQLIWPVEQGRSEADLWMGFKDKFHNKHQTGGLQHLLATQVRQELGSAVFDSYFKFCIVRDPWSKAISQFKYMKRRPDLMSFVGMLEGDCFKRYLSLIQRKEHVQWMPQYRFIFDDNGENLVDYIGRFESLECEAKRVLAVLNVPFVGLPHLNKGGQVSALEQDAEARELVAHIYRKDIVCFNYQQSPELSKASGTSY